MLTLRAEELVTNLLWTGGWDSTFRLLQLLLLEKKRVQPFYLIDEDRLSTGIEIKTMREIKRRLVEKHPENCRLLLATQFVAVADIEPDTEISRAFQVVRKETGIGTQYDWIARFCREYGLTDVELCITRDGRVPAVLAPFVQEYAEAGVSCYRLNEACTGEKRRLFRYFAFPLFNLSKGQMAAIAEEQGWTNFMNMTWFCHRPRGGRVPCGTCNPCVFTIEEGLGRRLPLSSRLAYAFNRVMLRPLKRTIKSTMRLSHAGENQ